MELLVNGAYPFQFKRYDNSSPVEWYAKHKIDDLELEVSFDEENGLKYGSNEIDWMRIENILSGFIDSKDFVLSKANDALIALNKVLGYWTDEEMKKGFYNLCYLEIVGNIIASYELVFELIGYTREHYFIDAPGARWYVSFNGKSLIGVKREVI